MTLDELKQSNLRRLNTLAGQGVGLDPILLLKARLDYVTEFLLPKACPAEVSMSFFEDMFERGWEEVMAEHLDGAEQQAARARLLDGVRHDG